MIPFDDCPRRCSRRGEGVGGQMEEVTQKKYELECLYFSRRQSGANVGIYYCLLYDQEAPYCTRCLFPLYIEEPRRNLVGLIN